MIIDMSHHHQLSRMCLIFMLSGIFPLAMSAPTVAFAAVTLPTITPESAAEYFYTNFQIIEIKNEHAIAYLDVMSLAKEAELSVKLPSFLAAGARKFGEIVPFFTDKPVKSVQIQIIRITNINEYNIRSGYTKVGDVRLVKDKTGWRVENFEVKEVPR